MTWRPYLPEPEPSEGLEPNDPEPVPLDVVERARDLCANFRVPPRQFRRRAPRRIGGMYRPRSDIVTVVPDVAISHGMGSNDGYYVTLIEELLHATGHPRRLGRP